MKKILGLTISAVLLLTLAVGGTYAYFSDDETSTGNTFVAGTLDLKLDSGDVNVVKFTVTDANPGESGTAYWELKNAGSLGGFLNLKDISVTDTESTGTTEFEADSIGGAGVGELGDNLDVILFFDANHDGIVDPGDTEIYNGKLSAIAASYNSNVALAAAGTDYISLNWSVATSVDNTIQGDKSELDISFTLDQVTLP